MKLFKTYVSLFFLTTLFAYGEPVDQLITTGRTALQQKNKEDARTAFT